MKVRTPTAAATFFRSAWCFTNYWPGKTRFPTGNQVVTLYNIQHKEVTLGKNIPMVLQKIVRKALQKERERRYNNFEEIKAGLLAARKSMA